MNPFKVGDTVRLTVAIEPLYKDGRLRVPGIEVGEVEVVCLYKWCTDVRSSAGHVRIVGTSKLEALESASPDAITQVGK